MPRASRKIKLWGATRNSSLFIIFLFFLFLPSSFLQMSARSVSSAAGCWWTTLAPSSPAPAPPLTSFPSGEHLFRNRSLSPVSLTLISFSICLSRWWKEAQESSLEAAADGTEGIRYAAVPSPSSSTSVESDLVFELRREGGRDSKRPAAEDEGVSCRCYALIRRDMCSMAVRWWASRRNVVGYLDYCRVIEYLQLHLITSPNKYTWIPCDVFASSMHK